jgi:hypothetical protein
LTVSERENVNSLEYEVGLGESAYEFGKGLDDSYWAKLEDGLVTGIDGGMIDVVGKEGGSWFKKCGGAGGGELVKTDKLTDVKWNVSIGFSENLGRSSMG